MANQDYGDSGDDMGMVIDTPSSEEKAKRTALIPTEFFGDKELKPGVECKVRIDRVLEGQVQVSYVPHEEDEEYPEMGESEPEGDEEMSGYMNG